MSLFGVSAETFASAMETLKVTFIRSTTKQIKGSAFFSSRYFSISIGLKNPIFIGRRPNKNVSSDDH
jgi:hypothetical protein